MAQLVSIRPTSGRLGVRIPNNDRLKLLKQVVTALLPNAHAPFHSRCGTLKNLHCSMGMSAEHR